jgi:AraC family transcriptional regulator
MNENAIDTLDKPLLVDGAALLIAGIGERYNGATATGIPAQWQRFAPHLAKVHTSYGVSCNEDAEGHFDYICGYEVPDFDGIPADWARLRIEPQKYLVFHDRGHISGIRNTFDTIWTKGLPESGYKTAASPIFEKYGPEFNGMTGLGGFEIWVPIRAL